MLPILQIGPFAVQTPGLILLAGVWIGLTLAERAAPRHNVDAGRIYNLAFIAMIAGILGARLAYVARFPSAFSASPGSLISLNPGLLDPLGGLAIGVIAATIYGQRSGLPLWPTLDALTPALAVMGLAIGLAHLAAGTAYGQPSNVVWAIELWGARRHPTQVYEILLTALILWAYWPGRQRLTKTFPGARFLTFLVLYAGSRLFLEGLRADSVLLPNGWRTTQIVAWGVMALSLFVFYRQAGLRLEPQDRG